jgi:hypothetical protein
VEELVVVGPSLRAPLFVEVVVSYWRALLIADDFDVGGSLLVFGESRSRATEHGVRFAGVRKEVGRGRGVALHLALIRPRTRSFLWRKQSNKPPHIRTELSITS